jgi:hypothetical protein
MGGKRTRATQKPRGELPSPGIRAMIAQIPGLLRMRSRYPTAVLEEPPRRRPGGMVVVDVKPRGVLATIGKLLHFLAPQPSPL